MAYLEIASDVSSTKIFTGRDKEGQGGSGRVREGQGETGRDVEGDIGILNSGWVPFC